MNWVQEVNNTNAYNVACSGSLFINGILKESISFTAVNGSNNAVFNQLNPYTFNITDAVKIIIFQQIS